MSAINKNQNTALAQDSVLSFDYSNNQIRTVLLNNEVWFVAHDVCNILDIANSRDAVSRLSDKMKGVAFADTPGGKQKMQIISEPGLYKLAFSSRKEEAEQFTDWVTSEVLPSIRKTGGYNHNLPTDYVGALEQLLESVKKQKALEEQAKLDKPKVEFAEAVNESKNGLMVEEVAKVLKVGRNTFYAWLRQSGYLTRDNKPYQQYLDAGYFELQTRFWKKEIKDQDGEIIRTEKHTYTIPLVTGRGQIYFARKWNQKNQTNVYA